MKRDDDSSTCWSRSCAGCAFRDGAAGLAAARASQAGQLTDLEILHRLCDEERASRIKSAVDRRSRSEVPELNTSTASTSTSTRSARSSARVTRAPRPHVPRQGHHPLFIGIPAPQDLPRAGARLPRLQARAASSHTATDAQRPRRRRDPRSARARTPSLLPRRPPGHRRLRRARHGSGAGKPRVQGHLERYEYRRSPASPPTACFKDWPKVFPDALTHR